MRINRDWELIAAEKANKVNSKDTIKYDKRRAEGDKLYFQEMENSKAKGKLQRKQVSYTRVATISHIYLY